jgi:hypothetical protein
MVMVDIKKNKRTNDIDAHIFTKKVNKETYEKQVVKFLGKL